MCVLSLMYSYVAVCRIRALGCLVIICFSLLFFHYPSYVLLYSFIFVALFCIFVLCFVYSVNSTLVRKMPGYNSPALFQNCCVVLCIVCFVSLHVLFVCKCVLYYCHRVATQLQLTNISYITHTHIQGVPGGMCQTSGGCSLYTDINQNTYVQS